MDVVVCDGLAIEFRLAYKGIIIQSIVKCVKSG